MYKYFTYYTATDAAVPNAKNDKPIRRINHQPPSRGIFSLRPNKLSRTRMKK